MRWLLNKGLNPPGAPISFQNLLNICAIRVIRGSLSALQDQPLMSADQGVSGRLARGVMKRRLAVAGALTLTVVVGLPAVPCTLPAFDHDWRSDPVRIS